MTSNVTTIPSVRRSLSDLPNISIALAEELRRVGITSPAALRQLGTERAWQRLFAAGLRNCVHTAFALEGAIREQPWRELAPERRAQLVQLVVRSDAKPATTLLSPCAA